MADLAVQFPAAQIFGLEPEPASVRLARQNTLPWAARCCVIEAAAWPTDGQVGYLSTTSRFASVKVNTSGRASGTHSITQAISLNTLIERSGDFDRVDFVKMDIEGAERRLLTECTEWAHRVHRVGSSSALHQGGGSSPIHTRGLHHGSSSARVSSQARPLALNGSDRSQTLARTVHEPSPAVAAEVGETSS